MAWQHPLPAAAAAAASGADAGTGRPYISSLGSAGFFFAVSTARGPIKLSPGDGCELECKVLGADDDKPPEGWQENAFDDEEWEAPQADKVWDGW